MSELVLKVTPEELRNRAGEVQDQVSEMTKVFENVKNTVDGTRSYWEGIAGDKARSEFEKHRSEADEALKRFGEYPTDLEQMAGVYQEAESANADIAKALDTDVIV